MSLIGDVEWWLLVKGNVSQPKFHGQSVLIRLFYDAVSKRIQNLNRTADDLKDLFFE
jgi:hypothetical protein